MVTAELIRTDVKPTMRLAQAPPTPEKPVKTEVEAKPGREWWRAGVTYQVYPRSFFDSNRDGNGDIPGIIQKMGYLADLGIDNIWMNPVHRSPGRDNGYDISSFSEVNDIFGTKQDLKEMVQEAHNHGIKVTLDFTPNHISIEHPLVENALKLVDRRVASGYDYKKDLIANMLIIRPANPDNPDVPPNNWKDFHSDGRDSFWMKLPTGEFIGGKFIPGGQVDLNHYNPLSRLFVKKRLAHWVTELGVDGVRLDVLDHIYEDELLRDFEPNPDATEDDIGTIKVWKWRDRLLLDDKACDFAREISDELSYEKVGKEVVTIGELRYDGPEDFSRMARYSREGKIKIPFNFSLLDTMGKKDANAARFKELWDLYLDALPDGAAPSVVLDNHDQSKRLADKVGVKNMRTAMMMLLTLGNKDGSNVCMYMGSETGMVKGNVITPENDIDPQGQQIGIERSRSHNRTGYVWNSQKDNKGFSGHKKPWLPAGVTADGRGAEEQLEDPNSMLNFTKDLIHARKGELRALQFGADVKYDSGDKDVWCYGRNDTEIGQNLMVTLSFADEPKVIKIPEGVYGVIKRSTDHDRKGERVDGQVKLGPNESCIIELRHLEERVIEMTPGRFIGLMQAA